MKRNFNSLKQRLNCDLFLLLLLLALFILKPQLITFLFSLAYLVYFKRNNCLLYLLLIPLLLLRFASFSLPLFKLAYVDEVKAQEVRANALIYRLKFYEPKDVTYGDIIKISAVKYQRCQKRSDLSQALNYKLSQCEIKTVAHLPSLRAYLFKKTIAQRSSAQKIIQSLLFKNTAQNEGYLLKLSWHFVYFRLLHFLQKKLKSPLKAHLIASALLSTFLGLNFQTLKIIMIEAFVASSLRKSTALSLAAIILLCLNPYRLFSLSFLFTFLIRFNFALAGPFKFSSLLMVLGSFFFAEVNPLLNLFFKKLSYLSLILLMVSLLLILSGLDQYITELPLFFSELTKLIKSLSIRGQLSFPLLLVIIAVIKRYELKSSFLQTALIGLILLSNLHNYLPRVTFIDVGQGDAILLKAGGNKETVLIDTGSKYAYYKLRKYLYAQGIYRIDKLVITHGDEDHCGNIRNLVNDFIIGEYQLDHEDIDGYFKLKSLNNSSHQSKNDNSLVHLTQINGLTFLFTGDISAAVEEEIFKDKFYRIDVLKLAHHGSASSSSPAILRNNVKFALISTNGRYHHPAEAVLKRLAQYRIKAYSTAEKGDISFLFTRFLNFIQCAAGDFVIIMK